VILTRMSSSSSSSTSSSDDSSAEGVPNTDVTTSKAQTDTESISDVSLRTNEIARTAIAEPVTPGRATPVRMKSIRVDTAKVVDEALRTWSGGDASVSNPFPGIKLHRHESREELFERAMSAWAGSDWQKKDAEAAEVVKKKHASQTFVPKAFPGIELHDEHVQDLRNLPGAKAGSASAGAVVPKVGSFPGIPIHDGSEDLGQLPGAKKGSGTGFSPPASPTASPPGSPHGSPPASPPISPRSRKDRGSKKNKSHKKSSSPKSRHQKPPAL